MAMTICERKDMTGARVLVATAITFALLACMPPVNAAMIAAWGDEADGKLSLGALEGDEVGEDLDVGEDPADASGMAEPATGPDAISGVDEPGEEERRIREGLESLGAKLDEELACLEASRARFDVARAGLARGALVRDIVSNVGSDTSVRIDQLDQRRLDAFALIKTVQEELMQSDDYGTTALMTGTATSSEVEFRHEMLERLVIAENARARRLLGDQRRLRVEHVLEEVSANHARRELRATMKPVNQAAWQVERSCARLRQCAGDARDAAGSASGVHPSLLETRDALLHRADAALAMVVDAERAVGAWYDEVDAAGAAGDAISYGEGVDFALPEEEFAEAWGDAIDAFFADRARTAGAIPLQGHGRTMAASAWRHHIDPRLCAAVSIAESSGGQACIRPFNAWGWGAADSDPYGLAAEWGSFEEAIEAWHEGMATSTSGLATAPSVSALGAVYCSSPAWGATVIEQMELISGYVR